MKALCQTLVVLVAATALPACSVPAATTGTDIRTPDAQAWIYGAVAAKMINESFDRSLHP